MSRTPLSHIIAPHSRNPAMLRALVFDACAASDNLCTVLWYNLLFWLTVVAIIVMARHADAPFIIPRRAPRKRNQPPGEPQNLPIVYTQRW